MTVLGAIIAGGAARRFGDDKGAALLNGVALIDHVVMSLRGQCTEMVIIGREWPGLISLPDRPHGNEGPLGGLNAALHYARAQGHDAVLCAGCDSLPVPDDLFARLAPGPSVIDGHWLLGLWPAVLGDALDHWLGAQPDRSIRGWMRQAHARVVPLGVPVYNINTPEMLADAEAALRQI